MKKLQLFAILCSILSLPLVAQVEEKVDRIYLKDKTLIECKVVEIGSEEIKYYAIGEEDGPLFVIENYKIERLVLSSGKEMTFEDLNEDAVNYTSIKDQKKNALKLNFTGVFSNQLSIAYERSIKPGRSFETELGFIGIGIDPMEREPLGISFGGGYKFFRNPDFYIKGMKYGHILNGLYFKPELKLSIYQQTYYRGGVRNPHCLSCTFLGAVISATALATAGRQLVFDDSVLLDIYAGVGIGVSNQEDKVEYVNNYGFSGPFDGIPITWTVGMKIGGLFK